VTATGIDIVAAASGVGREATMRAAVEEEGEEASAVESGVESVGTPAPAAVAVVAGIKALHHDDGAMGWRGMVVLVVDGRR